MEMVLKYRVQLATASRVDLSNLNSISRSLWDGNEISDKPGIIIK